MNEYQYQPLSTARLAAKKDNSGPLPDDDPTEWRDADDDSFYADAWITEQQTLGGLQASDQPLEWVWAVLDDDTELVDKWNPRTVREAFISVPRSRRKRAVGTTDSSSYPASACVLNQAFPTLSTDVHMKVNMPASKQFASKVYPAKLPKKKSTHKVLSMKNFSLQMSCVEGAQRKPQKVVDTILPTLEVREIIGRKWRTLTKSCEVLAPAEKGNTRATTCEPKQPLWTIATVRNTQAEDVFYATELTQTRSAKRLVQAAHPVQRIIETLHGEPTRVEETRVSDMESDIWAILAAYDGSMRQKQRELEDQIQHLRKQHEMWISLQLANQAREIGEVRATAHPVEGVVGRANVDISSSTCDATLRELASGARGHRCAAQIALPQGGADSSSLCIEVSDFPIKRSNTASVGLSFSAVADEGRSIPVDPDGRSPPGMQYNAAEDSSYTQSNFSRRSQAVNHEPKRKRRRRGRTPVLERAHDAQGAVVSGPLDPTQEIAHSMSLSTNVECVRLSRQVREKAGGGSDVTETLTQFDITSTLQQFSGSCEALASRSHPLYWASSKPPDFLANAVENEGWNSRFEAPDATSLASPEPKLRQHLRSVSHAKMSGEQLGMRGCRNGQPGGQVEDCGSFIETSTTFSIAAVQDEIPCEVGTETTGMIEVSQAASESDLDVSLIDLTDTVRVTADGILKYATPRRCAPASTDKNELLTSSTHSIKGWCMNNQSGYCPEDYNDNDTSIMREGSAAPSVVVVSDEAPCRVRPEVAEIAEISETSSESDMDVSLIDLTEGVRVTADGVLEYIPPRPSAPAATHQNELLADVPVRTTSTVEHPEGDQESWSLEEILFRYLRGQTSLYSSILRYEPVDFETLYEQIQQVESLSKCSRKKLSEFLDSKAINYCLPARPGRNGRKCY
ncbi:hypothetical protein BC832DRAFT_593348 [Gaertneriomyces semiglobifer]|nr:hypothetical protein BC832DRAFT_593348 [Gaertneriomyces semiglobifer]